MKQPGSAGNIIVGAFPSFRFSSSSHLFGTRRPLLHTHTHAHTHTHTVYR